jgi:hypothetical protein
VSHLPVVEAWEVTGGKLLWRPDRSLLWRWSRSTGELLLLLLPLLLLELLLLELQVIANSAAIEVGAADPQVGYTPCGT